MNANRLAARATNHRLTGCGIGEVLGMVRAMWWGWRDAASIAIALAVAWGPTFLVNRALIRRGRGHALAHGAHGHSH